YIHRVDCKIFIFMEKVSKVHNLQDPSQYEDEINYWTNIAPEEKLSMIQELREQYIYFFNIQKLYNKAVKDIDEFIKLLNYHKIKYLVVGAYALIYHTYPRNTRY